MVAGAMSGQEIVWTVDKYCDRIRLRRSVEVKRDQNSLWPHNFHVFHSRQQAIQFCVSRAESGVINLRRDLDVAWKRLKRLQKKLAEVV
jgi:hypothetical protein